MNVCVFCASSGEVAPVHVETANALGTWIGKRGHGLVWGGCNVGLMDVVGRAVQRAGGRTIAVIPEFLVARGLAFATPDEQTVTADMATRKAEFRRRSDAFVALPGGIGTWEEVFEVLALKKLGQLAAPIVLLNVAGCYDPLVAQLERSVRDGFTPPDAVALLDVYRDVEAAVARLEHREA